MATQSLTDAVQSLTPDQRQAVMQFIDYLKRLDNEAEARSAFAHAADEFIAQHPELLRRLAR